MVERNDIKTTIETVLIGLVIIPLAINALWYICMMIRSVKIRLDYKNGKYIPLTTVLAGYTVVRKKTNNKSRREHYRYYYFPYYKYQLGDTVHTITSEIYRYGVDYKMIGKEHTCYRHIDTNKALGNNPDKSPIVMYLGTFVMCIALIIFMCIFMSNFKIQ